MARKPKPLPGMLESQADAILRRADDELVSDLRQHAARMEEIARELTLPRNDPAYVAKLEERSNLVDDTAKRVEVVHVIKENGRTRVELGLASPRDHAGALAVGRNAAELFEARLIRHDDPADSGLRSPDYTQARPPRHEFGRERRSLPK